MTSPKHLWSGDWRADSAAAAEELAARRAAGRPDVPEPEPDPEAQRAAPRAPEPRERRRRRRAPRHLRVAVLAAVVVLLAGGGAVALTSALGTHESRTPTGSQAYLGLGIGSRALMGGLLINSVDPGSPAARAGVRAGDVLSRLGGIEVHTPGDVKALMQGRRPGDQLELGVERGNYSFTADVMLAGRP
jgi:membrane-associated protease RseP (regulator of RpoE activity)